ncbi:hypothetical protein N9444_02735 [Gammaproteobacteria bacterium]|jgi:hypothetical protein|nr:hypothetical protein [Gammaproteobacteria bacterium]MDG2236490.1 hypothetical protein [Arenicellales bacterium]
MKLLYTFVCLLLVSYFVQAGTTLSPEQEAVYKQGLDRPAVTKIRQYIDDCLADKPKIGYPCKFTWDTAEGKSIEEQGADKIHGRFMVLRFAPFDSKGDMSARGDLVTVIFDAPPHWMFTISVVYQGEEKYPVILGFYPVEMTPDERQKLGDDLSVYLNDNSFTR